MFALTLIQVILNNLLTKVASCMSEFWLKIANQQGVNIVSVDSGTVKESKSVFRSKD